MAIFGLLHGGFEGAWCWDLLSPEIRRLGHDVIAVDLPIDDVTATWDDHVEVALEAFTDPAIIVVAHSRSGRMVPRLLQRRNFDDVILLSAAIPGGKLPPPYESGGIPAGGSSGTQARKTDELGRSLCTEEAAAHLFSDCGPDIIAWAMENVRPQHDLPLPEDSHWPNVNVSYIYGDRDEVVDPEWIRAACRDRLGIEPIVLTGGHSLFVSQPRALALTMASLIPAHKI